MEKSHYNVLTHAFKYNSNCLSDSSKPRTLLVTMVSENVLENAGIVHYNVDWSFSYERLRFLNLIR